MQSVPSTASTITQPLAAPSLAAGPVQGASPLPLNHYQIIRRNGAVVPFEPNKIAVAMMKAFLAVHGTQGAASASVRETVDVLTQQVVRALVRSRPGRRHLPHRGRAGPGRTRPDARRPPRHRPRLRAVPRPPRAGARQARRGRRAGGADAARAGRRPAHRAGHQPAQGPDRESPAPASSADVKPDPIVAETMRNLYDGVPIDEVYKASILAARTLIEKDPDYTYATARLLLHTIFKEVLGRDVHAGRRPPQAYADYFPRLHQEGRRQRAAQPRAAAVRPEAPGRRAEGRARPEVRLPGPADPVRPLLPARAQDPHRAAAGLLHARRDGPGAQRDRPRSARHRVLRSAVELRLHVVDADPVQQRHAALAAVVLLPHHGAGRPGRHLRVDQGKRAAVQVRRRPGQRLDPRARARLAHQGHQRRIAGRGAVPEGGQRHRRGRQPGRQAQGRGLHLPGDLAPGHRGIPRAAQEHRRRPPPHPRHEHGQLDPRPVHAPRDGKGRVDPVLALQRARPARQVRRRLREGLRRLRREGQARRDQAQQDGAGHRHVAQDALDAVRDRPSLDHLQGCLQRALAAAARRRGALVQPVHRDHAEHQRHRNGRLQPRLGQPAAAPEGRRRSTTTS